MPDLEYAMSAIVGRAFTRLSARGDALRVKPAYPQSVNQDCSRSKREATVDLINNFHNAQREPVTIE